MIGNSKNILFAALMLSSLQQLSCTDSFASKQTVLAEELVNTKNMLEIENHTQTILTVTYLTPGTLSCEGLVDGYEIKAVETAGFNEFLYQPNSWAFIEWPQIIAPLLIKRVAHIELDYTPNFERLIKIEVR